MGFLSDIPVVGGLFGGEKVEAYNPDQDAYSYSEHAGSGAGSRRNADNAQLRTGPAVDYYNAGESRALAQGSRHQMEQYIGDLGRWANDASSSVAAQQFRQQSDAAAQQAMAVARSGRGGNMALAQRDGLQAQATMGQQAAAQAATLRAQEQQQYQMMMGQMLAQQRAQDLQAQGLDAQQAQYQAMLEMQQRQLNDQTSLGYDSLGHQQTMGAMQGSMAADAARGGYQMQAAVANSQADAQRDGQMLGLIGGAATGGLGLLRGSGGGGPKP